jgi:catechol 2,3-dioxygenase
VGVDHDQCVTFARGHLLRHASQYSMEGTRWPLRGLGLKVLDLRAEVDYYQRLGLRLLESDADNATLGFEDSPVLRLRLLEGGRPRGGFAEHGRQGGRPPSDQDGRPRGGFAEHGRQGGRPPANKLGRPRPNRSAGLYHFALLLPDARRLGQFLWRCADLGIPLDGASDHLVSQALYLSDPEGNGIEVYADRPAEAWTWDGDLVQMAVDPLDIDGLMRDGPGKLPEFPADSRLGHMHITSGDVDRSVDFYQELGMDRTAGFGPFQFVSWERYHHHLGINLLSGPGAERVTDDVAGLEYFEIERPGSESDLEPGTLVDTDGIRVELV